MTKKKYLNKPQIVEESLCLESIFNEQRLCHVIENLNKIQDKYPDKDLFFKIERYGYDGGMDLDLYENRKETDQERDARLARLRKQRAKEKEEKLKIEQKERDLLERLKKKYE